MSGSDPGAMPPLMTETEELLWQADFVGSNVRAGDNPARHCRSRGELIVRLAALLRETQAERDKAKAQVAELRDDPSRDCTSSAHPAWWRGHHWASEFLAVKVQEWIKGERADVGWPYAREEAGKALDAVQTLKARVAELEAENARLYECWVEGVFLVHDDPQLAPAFYCYRSHFAPHVGPFSTKDAAVRAYLDIIDAPAKGGTDAP